MFIIFNGRLQLCLNFKLNAERVFENMTLWSSDFNAFNLGHEKRVISNFCHLKDLAINNITVHRTDKRTHKPARFYTGLHKTRVGIKTRRWCRDT